MTAVVPVGPGRMAEEERPEDPGENGPDGGSAEPATNRFTDGATFVLDEDPGCAARWGAGEQVLWARGESLIVTAAPGVGKTTIAGQLTRALLGLRPDLLGLPVEPAGRVLYLAMDRPRQIARALRRMVTEADRATLAARLTVWKGPPPADIAKSPETLLALARRVDADVVVLDSLKDAAIGLSSDEVGAGVNIALQYLLAADVDVLVLHHQAKRSTAGTGAKPTELSDVYGSTWITSGAGSVVLLHGEPGATTVELRHLKQPAEPLGPLRLTFDRHAGTIDLDDGNFDALAWLRAQRTPITVHHLTAARFGPDAVTVSARIESCRRELQRLTRAGLANEHPGTRGGPGGGTPTTWTPAPTPGQAPFDALEIIP